MKRQGAGAPVVHVLHGWEVQIHEQVASTMDLAHELLASQRSAVVVARSQTTGRGSNGHQWLSHIGGMYLSWAFPGAAKKSDTLLAVFAVAAIDVLVLHGLLGCRIQRPNGIEVASKKIAGLLTECSSGGCVLGLGVNLNNEVTSIPMATSFKEVTDRELDPRSFLTVFVRNVDQELGRLVTDPRLITRRWWSLVTP